MTDRKDRRIAQLEGSLREANQHVRDLIRDLDEQESLVMELGIQLEALQETYP